MTNSIRMIRALICGIGMWLFVPVLPAAPVLSTLNYARFRNATDPLVTYACENFNGVPCNGSAVAPGTNWTIEYFSRSSAGYGVMHAEASVELTGDGSLGSFPSFGSVGGRAGFRDVLLFTGDSGPGTALFSFHVTGTSTATPGQSGRPQIQYVPVVGGQLDYAHQVAYLFNANGDAIVEVPFVFGTPTEFEIDFYALAQIFQWTDGAAASADYFHTAVLNSISVRSAAGELVSNFNIQSESGTLYGANGVTTPEPAAFGYIGVGLLALGWRRIRRNLKATSSLIALLVTFTWTICCRAFAE